MRAKVARLKADMRTCGIALESYAVDNNGKYPMLRGYSQWGGLKYTQWDRGSFGAVVDLSTPVAYLSSVMVNDPFYTKRQYFAYGIDTATINSTSLSICINYLNVILCRKNGNTNPVDDGRPKWFLISMGPDQVRGPDPRGNTGWGIGSYASDTTADKTHRYDAWNYDPSNGSLSAGDILYHP